MIGVRKVKTALGRRNGRNVVQPAHVLRFEVLPVAVSVGGIPQLLRCDRCKVRRVVLWNGNAGAGLEEPLHAIEALG